MCFCRWFLWVFYFPSWVPCHLNWIFDLHSCETEMYRSPKHQKNLGTYIAVLAETFQLQFIFLCKFLIMERETPFIPEFWKVFVSITSIIAVWLGFLPSSIWILQDLSTCTCIWSIGFQGLCSQGCVPIASMVGKHHWPLLRVVWSLARLPRPRCWLRLLRPTQGETDSSEPNGVDFFCATDEIGVYILGKLRSELNLDIFDISWYTCFINVTGSSFFVDISSPRLFQKHLHGTVGPHIICMNPQLPVPNVVRCCRGEAKVHPHRPFLVQSGWATNKKHGWLGYIGDYSTQLYRDYDEPL